MGAVHALKRRNGDQKRTVADPITSEREAAWLAKRGIAQAR
jgi:UDP-glucose 4-epimerase